MRKNLINKRRLTAHRHLKAMKHPGKMPILLNLDALPELNTEEWTNQLKQMNQTGVFLSRSENKKTLLIEQLSNCFGKPISFNNEPIVIFCDLQNITPMIRELKEEYSAATGVFKFNSPKHKFNFESILYRGRDYFFIQYDDMELFFKEKFKR